MFHSVRDRDPQWLWDWLTCPVTTFERMLQSLRSRGYGPATLDELVAMQASGVRPRERRVVLTFDDGYLDNWVYVRPLLKRAGLKGIVYVNPDFVDPGETPRPSLEDVWSGKLAASELQSKGFLNWAEIEALDREGVLMIGSHSMSHTWFATGPRIVDFHRPGLETPWLAWNARPERKPFYRLEDQSGFVPWGTPIHEHGRSLGVRRFLPDPDVARALTAHVAGNGGARFFERADWESALRNVAAEADRGRGRLESDEEETARFVAEIGNAFEALESRLGHEVRHFCWPGGAYCDASWSVLESIGYRSTTLRRNDRQRWDNAEPRLVRRISEFRRFSFMGGTWSHDGGALLAAACDKVLRLPGSDWRLQYQKALAAARGVRGK